MSAKKLRALNSALRMNSKSRTVHLVGAALGHDVDYATGVPTVLCRVAARLHAEFLKRVGIREGLVDVGVNVRVVGAVEPVTGLIRSRPVGVHQHSARKGLGIALIRPVGVRRQQRAGRDQRQAGCVAPIQRKIDNPPGIDDFAQSRSGRIDLRLIGLNRDLLAGLRQPQRYVHGYALVRLQRNAFAGKSSEPRDVDLQPVRGGPDRGKNIVALRIGYGIAGSRRSLVDNCDFGIGNHPAGRVRHRPDDRAKPLGQDKARSNERQE